MLRRKYIAQGLHLNYISKLFKYAIKKIKIKHLLHVRAEEYKKNKQKKGFYIENRTLKRKESQGTQHKNCVLNQAILCKDSLQ